MRRSRRAFTLPEIMVAASALLILLAGGYAIVSMSMKVYQRVAGHEDGALQMKRASRHLYKDLLQGYFTDVLVERINNPAGTGDFGDGVGVLSNREGNEARGISVPTADGAPFWQRNVIYYVAPSLLDPCTGGADVDGYEDMCPHKYLLRKVVDNPPATDPLTPANQEIRLPSLAGYLDRPAGLNVGPMYAQPGLTHVEVIATNLLTMRVQKNPDPNFPGEVLVTLRAFNAPASYKNTNVGSTLLSNHANTLTHVISVFPRNNQ